MFLKTSAFITITVLRIVIFITENGKHVFDVSCEPATAGISFIGRIMTCRYEALLVKFAN